MIGFAVFFAVFVATVFFTVFVATVFFTVFVAVFFVVAILHAPWLNDDPTHRAAIRCESQSVISSRNPWISLAALKSLTARARASPDRRTPSISPCRFASSSAFALWKNA